MHVLVRVALEYHEHQIVTLVSEQSKRLDIYGSYSRLTIETMEGAHVSLKSKPLPFRAKGAALSRVHGPDFQVPSQMLVKQNFGL